MEKTKKYDFMWALLKWPEVEERIKIVDTAILPCGAIEQHGPHLPLDVDFYDAEYLARMVADACQDPKPFVLPGIPYGVSYHHSDFKGTICVSNNSLSSMIYDIGMSLASQGIKKIILLNGHGDNSPTLQYAAQMINRDARIFVCVETGETSDVDLYKLADTESDVHAGEIETSTTLALRPDLVDMDKAENQSIEFDNKFLNFSSDRSVNWYVHTKKLTKSGIMGNAKVATAEKGRKMWEVMIKKMTEFVETIKNTPFDELFQKKY
ncbi:creatininase family protein [Bacteroidota bacterium]